MRMAKMGVHILAEFYGVDPSLLEKVAPVRDILESAVASSGLNRLDSRYHQFSPHGVTGFVLLAESHISLHTWPEKGHLALDIFTCGPPEKAEKAYRLLHEKFSPESAQKTVKHRGSVCTGECD